MVYDVKQKKVINDACGYSYEVTKEILFDRFLYLGVISDNLYNSVSEQIRINIANVRELPYTYVVDKAVNALANNKVHSIHPAMLSLAIVFRSDDVNARRYVANNINKAFNTPYYLYTFVNYVQQIRRGWSKLLRKIVSTYYQELDTYKFEQYAWKFKQRDGWSHKDLIRLSHPVFDESKKDEIAKFILNPDYIPVGCDNINAVKRIQHSVSEDVIADLVTKFNITREGIPTEYMTNVTVLEALVKNMPHQALLRNLNNLTKHGVSHSLILDRLKTVSKNSKINVFHSLLAYLMYSKNDNAYYNVLHFLEEYIIETFKTITKIKGKTLIAVDVSGSMQTTSSISKELSCTDVAAVLASLLHNVCDNSEVYTFDTRIRKIDIGKNISLKEVQKKLCANGGGTDVSLPFTLPNFDNIITITDNMTWADGNRYESESYISNYRRRNGNHVRAVNIQAVVNEYTNFSTNDAGTLDIPGTVSNLVEIITEHLNQK